MDGSISTFLKGKKAKLEENRGIKQITWKQGSFLGYGGDQSQQYYECIYSLENSDGGKVPVFIQKEISPPDEMELDSNLQYGLTNGTIFFVLHSKTLKPYQHRFVPNSSTAWLFTANSAQKFYTEVDFSFIAGDYLHDL